MKTFDVIVVGLGTAGAPCALACAKAGLKTLGLEACTGMGGQNTLGGVNFGGLTMADAARDLERAAEQVKAFLEIRYKTVPTEIGPFTNGVRHVKTVSNGLTDECAAKVIIDCSGDAAAVRLAGGQTTLGRAFDARVNAVSKPVVLRTRSGYRPNYRLADLSLSGSWKDYSAGVMGLSDSALARYDSREGNRAVAVPSLLGVREGARVVTEAVVTFRDCLLGRFTDQPVMCDYTPFDLCKENRDWAFESDEAVTWAVLCGLNNFAFPAMLPYGAFVPKGVPGMLVASKHLGVDHDAAAGVRMMPQMRESGLIAATAAEIAVKRGLPVREVPVADLRVRLAAVGISTKPQKRTAGYYNLRGQQPLPEATADIVAALETDLVQLSSWVMPPRHDSGERAAAALFAAWRKAERGEGKELAGALSDRLSSAPDRRKANMAFALGLMGDARGLSVLTEIVRQPGGKYDPAVAGAYPMRIKAIILLGRIGTADTVPLLMDIVRDGARRFTSDLPLRDETAKQASGWVNPYGEKSLDAWRFAALSYALMALQKLLARFPNPALRAELVEWGRNIKSLNGGKNGADMADLLRRAAQEK